MNFVFVGLGGALGAILRYLLSLIPLQDGGFPLKTMCINVLGAFVIGILAALPQRGAVMDDRLMLFLKVGLCGGFTTFSTFALETTDLLRQSQVGMALAYILLSVLLSLGAIWCAGALVR